MLDRFVQRFREDAWLYVFTFLISLLVNVRYFFFVRQEVYPGELVYSTISTLFWSGLLTVIAALLLPRILKNIYLGLVVLVSLLLFVFEHYLLSAYKSVYTDSIAINILATNPAEAQEFTAIIPLHFLLVPFVVGVSILMLCYYMRGRLASLVGYVLPKKSLWAVALVASPIALACVSSIPAQYKMYYNNTPAFAYMTPYDRLPQGTLACIKQGREVEAYFNRIHSIDAGDIHNDNTLGRVNVVLVMGESLRRDYMGCYGYRPNTTPLLDSMIKAGDVLMFNDVVAPAPSTVASVMENLTFHRLDAPEVREDCAALLPVLHKAGYFTYWVSNQEAQGAYVQPIAALAATADSTKYIKMRTSTDWDASYDAEILPHTLMLSQRGDSTSIFQVVHLMGSHSLFGYRYPSEYDHFKASDLPPTTAEGHTRPQGEREDKNLIEYLNSIYYNDFVVAQIIKKHQRERSVVIYVADHGVEVHDNPDNPSHCGHPTSARGLKIPLLVYFSPELRRAYPELWAEIASARDNLIMTDLLSHAVCELLGVKSKYANPAYNFFSSRYDNSRERVVSAFGTTISF